MENNYSFVITGIGHALAPGQTTEFKKSIAEQFVISKMDSNEEVTLLLEKDNHYDDIAIGVYHNYRRIGYVGTECEIIKRFMDKEILEGVAFAVIDGRHSTHTLNAHIINPDEEIFGMRLSGTTKKPYDGRTLWIPFTEEERARNSFYAKLVGHQSDYLSSEEMLRMVRNYCSLGFSNVCIEEFIIVDGLYNKFCNYQESDSNIDECYSLISDMHSRYSSQEIKGAVMASAYNKVKKIYGKEFITQFEEWRFGFGESVFQHIDEARQTMQSLKHWLLSFRGGIFRGYPWNWNEIASFISSKGYSRRDVYTFFEVMILVDWLNEVVCSEIQTPEFINEMPDKLKTKEALRYLKILRNAGYLDSHFKPAPHLKKLEIAVIANCLGDRLKIRERWCVIGGYWDEPKLCHYYHDQRYYEKIEKIENEINRLLK